MSEVVEEVNKNQLPETVFFSLEQVPKAPDAKESAAVLIESVANMKEVTNEEDAAMVGEFVAQCRNLANSLDKLRLEGTLPARQIQAVVNGEFNELIEQVRNAGEYSEGLLTPYLQEKERKRLAAETAAREERERVEREEAEARQAIADAEAEEAAEAQRKADAENASTTEETPAEEPAEPEGPTPKEKAEAARKRLEELGNRKPATTQAVEKGVQGVAGATVKVKENWTWEIDDITKVPEEYLVDPEKRVQKSVLTTMAKAQKAKANVPGIRFFDKGGINTRVKK